MQSSITAVSGLLKMPATDLVSALGTGQSLSSIAASKGISHDRLLSTISTAISSSIPQGSQPLSGDQLASVAGRIADSTSVPAHFALQTAR
jgi:uncharacterized protein YidB (DUF937 family)